MSWFALITALLCLPLRYVSATDVFAHFMLQNTPGYDGDEFVADILLAKSIGIDGFIVNWVPPICGSTDASWMLDRLAVLSGDASVLGFKIIQSFDMSYTACTWTPQQICESVAEYSYQYATYRFNGLPVITTYGGDDNQRGGSSRYNDAYFAEVRATCLTYTDGSTGAPMEVYLSPALTWYSLNAQLDPTGPSNLVSDYQNIDGYSNWQAWPLNVAQNTTTTVDQEFQSALNEAGRKGPYIMSISPWQYKDLNTGNSMDAWVSYSDYLFHQRWATVTGPSKTLVPDIIQILTWNDWSESHYIRDLPSQTPGAKDYVYLNEMDNYVVRMNHAPWRVMVQYYTAWLKTGSPPAVTNDQVVVWYRTLPRGITNCTYGQRAPIRNADLPVDGVFFWGISKEVASISVTVGSNQYKTFAMVPGTPTTGMVPFPPEVYDSGVVIPEVAIVMNGQTTYVNDGTHNISNNCYYQNYNPEVFLVGDLSLPNRGII